MAMRRSRGVKSLTTLPPIRISPAVGVSRPAIMRRRVVFPEPEGPRKTRNSPSRVSRFTSLTAPSSPSLNTLVSLRVSTTAIKPPCLFVLPSVKDPLVLRVGDVDCLVRCLIAARHGCKHGGDHPGVEGFINASGGIAGIADVGGPVQHVSQNRIFIGRHGPRIIGD